MNTLFLIPNYHKKENTNLRWYLEGCGGAHYSVFTARISLSIVPTREEAKTNQKVATNNLKTTVLKIWPGSSTISIIRDIQKSIPDAVRPFISAFATAMKPSRVSFSENILTTPIFLTLKSIS
ncbi:hypothetical protein H6787_01685 [Candidatus Nomurabacteria bacterium]|nr:hypothetical protein [Candidatus Nomurabacteria bacterium]